MIIKTGWGSRHYYRRRQEVHDLRVSVSVPKARLGGSKGWFKGRLGGSKGWLKGRTKIWVLVNPNMGRKEMEGT